MGVQGKLKERDLPMLAFLSHYLQTILGSVGRSRFHRDRPHLAGKAVKDMVMTDKAGKTEARERTCWFANTAPKLYEGVDACEPSAKECVTWKRGFMERPFVRSARAPSKL